ncbi:hypothetical protein N7463_007776 [Penicillium fimorum]|uniref:Uncharacterized protein n=1 Tax=Penicillium fimorum TaxID=1882269 RepID=A0A9W9XWX8_9EURO|nr:hypothetical protein N7463_007776 [Penicillium fimorum]
MTSYLMINLVFSGGQFLFIPVKDSNDPITKRLARSHAVAHGLRNKRRIQQISGHNFHVLYPSSDQSPPASKEKHQKALIAPTASLATDSSDPFEMLAAESPKLRELLNRHRFQKTAELVFSVSDELVFQNFRSVLQKGLVDNALLSAIMLTFSFTVTDCMTSRECLEYQNTALSSIRRRMSFPDRVTTEPTIGAILLLAGIEYSDPKLKILPPRSGLGCRVKFSSTWGQYNTFLTKGVKLSDDIKRAVFWSDLNGSVMTGSCRVVDHTTFSELWWRRDPSHTHFFILPSGFQNLSYTLGQDFVEILKDIFALQCIRDSAILGKEDAMPMAHIDNHQASIQSRLVSLPILSPISECCHQAAYLCSTMLRCKIWRTSTIPVSQSYWLRFLPSLSRCTNLTYHQSHLSLQLLYGLQTASDNPAWEDSPDLLAWLLHIGGAFAPVGTIRQGYVQLLQLNHTRFRWLYKSWPKLLVILKQFIWSDKAFLSQVKAFWEENSIQTSS